MIRVGSWISKKYVRVGTSAEKAFCDEHEMLHDHHGAFLDDRW